MARVVPFPGFELRPGDTFPIPSSRGAKVIIGEHGPCNYYTMVVSPDGYIVHDFEGCERERFVGGEQIADFCVHTTSRKVFIVTTETEETKAVTTYAPGPLVPQRIDFTDGQLKAIANVICKDAPRDMISLFVGACRHSGLDPFLRQIYLLPLGNGRFSIHLGIDGWRVLAERTGFYDGQDGPFYSETGKADDWWDVPTSAKPKYCKVSIYRKGVRRPFTSICSMDAYFVNRAGNRWEKDPPGMLAIKAEAQAFRRAFPANMMADTAAVRKLEAVAAEEVDDELPEFEAPPDYNDTPPDYADGEFSDIEDDGPATHPVDSAEAGDVNAAEFRQPASGSASQAESVQDAAGTSQPAAAVEPTEAGPPVVAEAEPGSQTHPATKTEGAAPPSVDAPDFVAPSVLMNQMTDEWGSKATVAARNWIASHFMYSVVNGVMTMASLKDGDRARVSMYFRDVLRKEGGLGWEHMKHSPDPQYREDMTFHCAVCKTPMPEPQGGLSLG